MNGAYNLVTFTCQSHHLHLLLLAFKCFYPHRSRTSHSYTPGCSCTCCRRSHSCWHPTVCWRTPRCSSRTRMSIWYRRSRTYCSNMPPHHSTACCCRLGCSMWSSCRQGTCSCTRSSERSRCRRRYSSEGCVVQILQQEICLIPPRHHPWLLHLPQSWILRQMIRSWAWLWTSQTSAMQWSNEVGPWLNSWSKQNPLNLAMAQVRTNERQITWACR